MKVKLKRWKICAYCGEKLAWRWAWSLEPSIVWDEKGRPHFDLWPIRWHRTFEGNCCNPPSL